MRGCVACVTADTDTALQGSECTMLCNDFARLGYDYVVVDAGVQLTYDWNLAREMMACECMRSLDEGREGEGGTRGSVWMWPGIGAAAMLHEVAAGRQARGGQGVEQKTPPCPQFLRAMRSCGSF